MDGAARADDAACVDGAARADDAAGVGLELLLKGFADF